MKHIIKAVIWVSVLVAAQSLWAGPSKVQICHIPPDDPSNFHTITVSERALSAHLGHGDVSGSCFESAEVLCNDGDACTIDAMDEETETCLIEHPAVDCDDGLSCTTDSCDSIHGCQYAPIDCDDGDLCTIDACSEFDGECTHASIDCGLLGICLSDTGQCDFPCDGITCEPIDQCHEAGACVLPGECLDGIERPDGTACNDGNDGTLNDQCTNGICAGIPVPATISCYAPNGGFNVDGTNFQVLNYGETTEVDVQADGSTISLWSCGWTDPSCKWLTYNVLPGSSWQIVNVGGARIVLELVD